MDWKAIQFDWNRARAFLVAAEEGSFSAAARSLGTTQPTVGRQVTALEAELAVALFERVGNRLELTSSGLDLVEHVRSMAEAAGRLSLTAAGRSVAVEGTVAITASEAISAFLLPPVIADLRRELPGVELELVVSNQTRDLNRREADIAIRNFRPTSPELVARQLPDAVGYLYASPAYLERIGPVDCPADLSSAEFFAFDRTSVMVDGFVAMGVPVTSSNFTVVTSNHLVQWELCKAGAGIAVMMSAVGEAEPAVVRVLPELPPFPVPMWLVSHRELRMSRRIRLVFDRIAEALSRPTSPGES